MFKYVYFLRESIISNPILSNPITFNPIIYNPIISNPINKKLFIFRFFGILTILTRSIPMRINSHPFCAHQVFLCWNKHIFTNRVRNDRVRNDRAIYDRVRSDRVRNDRVRNDRGLETRGSIFLGDAKLWSKSSS